MCGCAGCAGTADPCLFTSQPYTLDTLYGRATDELIFPQVQLLRPRPRSFSLSRQVEIAAGTQKMAYFDELNECSEGSPMIWSSFPSPFPGRNR